MNSLEFECSQSQPVFFATGMSGAIGSYIQSYFSIPITSVDPRDSIPEFTDVPSVLLLLGWSSNPSTPPDQESACYSRDVDTTIRLATCFADANPHNKIIFVSTSGDLYKNRGVVATEETSTRAGSFYSRHKLVVESGLSELSCQTVVLRVSNVWGCDVSHKRLHGLIDKLLLSSRVGNSISISCTLNSVISIIHVADLADLILLVAKHPSRSSDVFNASHENVSVHEVIDIVRAKSEIHLSFSPFPKRYVTMISAQKAISYFNWSPTRSLC